VFARHAALAVALLAPPAAALHAQAATPATEAVSVVFVPEARLDVLSSPTAVQAGVGVTTPLSNYFSLGVETAGGISADGFSGRTDAFGRFSLDPYHQYAWEPYIGAGATVRYDTGGRGTRTYLLGTIGVNAPNTGGLAPGVEFGVGGGIRFGVILRWAQPTAR